MNKYIIAMLFLLALSLVGGCRDRKNGDPHNTAPIEEPLCDNVPTTFGLGEEWVIVPSPAAIEDALAKVTPHVCREVFLADVAIKTVEIFEEAGIDVKITFVDPAVTNVYPTMWNKRKHPNLVNIMNFHSGPLDGYYGFAKWDSKHNKNWEHNEGSIFDLRFGVDVGEISNDLSLGTYSALVDAVSAVFAHEIGHNMGFDHTKEGIMAEDIDVDNPDLRFVIKKD